jgi:predicted Zn-dependent peptidase
MYKKYTLENGVRIISEEIPYVRSVAMGVWIDVGSRDEIDVNNGISHFIEHLMFKGTEKRSAKDIAEALDAVGGQLNAFTAKEYTCYYARVLDEHFDLAIDVLADMVLNSKFAEKDIEKEKKVVIEEIKMYEDSPDELVHDLLTTTMWRGHSLGKPIIGTKEVISNINRDDVVSFFQNNYIPENIVIAVAGNIKHETIVAKLEPIFSLIKGNKVKRNLVHPDFTRNVVTKEKDIEQVHLCVGTKGLPANDDLSYVKHVINSTLGGGISSRLFQSIREDRGLAYSVYSYTTSYQDAGLFAVYAGLSPDNLEEVISLIKEETSKFAGDVTDYEVNKAKEQLKGGLFLGLESVGSRMSRLGKSELTLGRISTPDEVVEKIDAVTKEKVVALANELFKEDNYVFTAISPKGLDIEAKLK